MSRYAVVSNGIVENVALWDGESEWFPGDGCTLHWLDDDSPVGPGWTRSKNNRWVAPQQTDPEPVAQPLTIDPAALAAFVQAVADPDIDARQALADFASALNPTVA